MNVKPSSDKNTDNAFAGRGALLFLIRALPAAAVLFVMLLYARCLPRELYGEYQLFWVRYSVLSTFTAFGIPAVLPLFSKGQLSGLIQQIKLRHKLIFIAVNMAAGVLFSYWERSLFPDARAFAPVFLGIWTFGLILEAILISYRWMRSLFWINALFALGFIAVHIRMLPVGYSFLKDLFALVGWLALLRLIALYFFARRAYRQNRPEPAMPSKSIWLHLTLTDMMQQLSRYTDKLLVGFLSGPVGAAIYFNGAQEVPFLSALLGAASGNFLLQSVHTNEPELVQKARWLRLSGALLGALVFPLFWGLFLFKEALFEVVFAGRYGASVPVFAFFALALPLRAYPFSAMLQHLRKGRLITLGTALDLLLVIALMFVFYPVWGMEGIALAFVMGTLFLAVFYTWHTVRLTGLPLSQLFPLRRWLFLFSVSGFLLGLLRYGSAIWHFSSLQQLLSSLVCMALLALAGLYTQLKRQA